MPLDGEPGLGEGQVRAEGGVGRSVWRVLRFFFPFLLFGCLFVSSISHLVQSEAELANTFQAAYGFERHFALRLVLLVALLQISLAVSVVRRNAVACAVADLAIPRYRCATYRVPALRQCPGGLWLRPKARRATFPAI